MATRFVPATEVAAAELAKTGGSITSVPDGRLIRISNGTDQWDMDRPWHGRELTSWTPRKSVWGHVVIVQFYVELSVGSARLPTFSLTLKQPITDAEIADAANTYIMLLNLRRKD